MSRSRSRARLRWLGLAAAVGASGVACGETTGAVAPVASPAVVATTEPNSEPSAEVPAMEPILVSQTSFDSDEPFDLILSNHNAVRVLLAEGVAPERVPRAARLSSAVLYYDRQIHNGGFPQFVFNSRLEPRLIADVREGLSVIGGEEHRRHFDETFSVLEELAPEALDAFLGATLEKYASNRVVADLHEAFSGFYELPKLTPLNVAYLKAQPELRVLPVEELVFEIERLVGHSIAEGDELRAARGAR